MKRRKFLKRITLRALERVKKKFPYKVRHWFKYKRIFKRLNYMEFFINRFELGGDLRKWNHWNFEYIDHGNSTGNVCVFNLKSQILTFRRLVSFVVNFFECHPYTRIVVINGFPKYKNVSCIRLLCKILKKFSKFYLLRALPGTFTNRSIVYKFWSRQTFLDYKNEKIKKWFEAAYEGTILVDFIPDLVFVLSTCDDYQRILDELEKLHLPSIGIVNTESDVKNLMYPIRGDDDSPQCVCFYMKMIKDSLILGKLLSFKYYARLFNLNYNTLLFNEIYRRHRNFLKKQSGTRKFLNQNIFRFESWLKVLFIKKKKIQNLCFNKKSHKFLSKVFICSESLKIFIMKSLGYR